jgi:hypothetical protein
MRGPRAAADLGLDAHPRSTAGAGGAGRLRVGGGSRRGVTGGDSGGARFKTLTKKISAQHT